LINVYASIINDKQYSSFNNPDEQYYFMQRAERASGLPINSYFDSLPGKRQSYGRKQQWDAFFGRR